MLTSLLFQLRDRRVKLVKQGWACCFKDNHNQHNTPTNGCINIHYVTIKTSGKASSMISAEERRKSTSIVDTAAKDTESCDTESLR
jgi:hypothetical protein